MFSILTDRKFRLARKWSNQELRRVGHHFTGNVVNVSAWKDEDKEGSYYRSYFPKAQSYHLTNYIASARGWQGFEDEIALDLEKQLPKKLRNAFDVVFNHTTLEHIYKANIALHNLCLMTRDIVIVVVPFLQEMHAEYGDYWRFTPLAMKSLFEEEGLELVYSSFNEHPRSSVYLFCVASKHPLRWRDKIGNSFNYRASRRSFLDFRRDAFVGVRSIENNILASLWQVFQYFFRTR